MMARPLGLLLAIMTSLTPGTSAPAPRSAVGFTEWSAACPVEIVNPDRASPIVWRDCPGAQGCREMAADGSHEGSAFGMTPRFFVDRDPVLVFSRLALHRSEESTKEWIVADADGPVRFAMRQRFNGEPRCTMVEESASPENIGFVARGDGESPLRTSPVDGLLVVAPGAPAPRVTFRNADAEVSGWTVRQGRIVRVVAPSGRIELLHPDGSLERVLHDPEADPDGLPAAGNAPVTMGDRILFEIGRGRGRAVMVFDHERGAHALLRWPISDEHGAGNVGTDGQWLVWTEGRARGGDGLYARMQVMAARVPAAGAPLEPHVVADDPNRTIGAAPFVVGCGRAAHETPDGPLVVDLERGTTWSPSPREGIRWGRPIGLTCDELWMTTFRDAEANIARVRLPYGMPPRSG